LSLGGKIDIYQKIIMISIGTTYDQLVFYYIPKIYYSFPALGQIVFCPWVEKSISILLHSQDDFLRRHQSNKERKEKKQNKLYKTTKVSFRATKTTLLL